MLVGKIINEKLKDKHRYIKGAIELLYSNPT